MKIYEFLINDNTLQISNKFTQFTIIYVINKKFTDMHSGNMKSIQKCTLHIKNVLNENDTCVALLCATNYGKS